jgi:low affinity Fe/Cu permease
MAERSWFDRFAAVSADALGTPAAFSAAGAVVGWALTGPLFHWSDTWQLVINTSTTVVTFLAVFLIQHTQNRDTAALQLKVDELLAAQQNASNLLIDIQHAGPEAVARVQAEHRRARTQAERGETP